MLAGSSANRAEFFLAFDLASSFASSHMISIYTRPSITHPANHPHCVSIARGIETNTLVIAKDRQKLTYALDGPDVLLRIQLEMTDSSPDGPSPVLFGQYTIQLIRPDSSLTATQTILETGSKQESIQLDQQVYLPLLI
jgi:hypothetical protein